MTEHACGRIGLVTVSAAADRAAERIAEAASPRAVCLAPDGSVTVERADYAIPDELVGVYRPREGRFKLWGMIEADLMEAMKERRITGGCNQRYRVESKRGTAERYEGTECKNCGGTERYVSSLGCVACARRRSAAKSAA
jgi:hypothetical protein